MNYQTTQELLHTIHPFAEKSNIQISISNKDYRGKEYKSDYITIDKNNSVGFEVFENEIIVFFFSEHHHFEDYSFTLDDGEPDYIMRAKEFLTNLLTCTIRQEKTFKGKTLTRERYIFVHKDGTEECPAGVWIHSLFICLVPFLPKSVQTQAWKFDSFKGCFVKYF